MSKRKLIDNNILHTNNTQTYNNFDLQYYNLNNCDKIYTKNKDIYFSATINDITIHKLIEFIQYIHINHNNNNTIYIHITSKGGYLSSIFKFIDFKKTINYHLTSIMIDECNDIAIILSNLCDYRLVTKNTLCKLSKYNDNNHNNYRNYWGYFKQCNEDEESILLFKTNLYNLFLNTIKTKITLEKFNTYLIHSHNINIWNSKKSKKLGLIDEII
tara:strand:+ start:812 stop:1456 length:645 start_codon:yes stop_codon:yes gene_type:complete